MIYIPKGMAHGFCSLSELSTPIYKTSTVYNPECDSGILWSSVPVEWPTKHPIISERDVAFLSFNHIEHRIGGSLENTEVTMKNTFWIGVQPALSEEYLNFTVDKLEEFFGIGF